MPFFHACLYNFGQKSSSGRRPKSQPTHALGLVQIVMNAWENDQPTQFYMLKKLSTFHAFNNFQRKLTPGDARPEVLQEPVGGFHADQGRKFRMPWMIFGPG